MTSFLIVDDHALICRGLRELLSVEFPEAEILEAKDSSEAVLILQDRAFALTLLDINLPGRSGFELLQDARRLQPQMPVLIISAYQEAEFAVRAFKLGAAGYISKQSASDELLQAVKKCLVGGKYVTASIAEALAAALGSEISQSPHEALSHRELQVLQWIATGKTLKDIAAELSLSEKTVATYRRRITEKMGISSNIELTRYALQHRLVD
jgi:two-component system, NarL family, invasion response regulator UvrY